MAVIFFNRQNCTFTLDNWYDSFYLLQNFML